MKPTYLGNPPPINWQRIHAAGLLILLYVAWPAFWSALAGFCFIVLITMVADRAMDRLVKAMTEAPRLR